MKKMCTLKIFDEEFIFTVAEGISSIAGAMLGIALVLFSKRKV